VYLSFLDLSPVVAACFSFLILIDVGMLEIRGPWWTMDDRQVPGVQRMDSAMSGGLHIAMERGTSNLMIEVAGKCNYCVEPDGISYVF